MKLFVSRVELRGTPGVLVYARLHAAMEKIGFKRTIVGTGGQRLDLPHGTYAAYTRSTLASRSTAVASAVRRVWKDYVFLTIEAEDMEGFLLFSKED